MDNAIQWKACVAGAWTQEKARARGDTPRVSPSRAPVLSFAHYFQASATQAIHWMVQSVILILFRWIMFFPMDSAIRRLNNRGLEVNVPRTTGRILRDKHGCAAD